jgi:hypothetical protein
VSAIVVVAQLPLQPNFGSFTCLENMKKLKVILLFSVKLILKFPFNTKKRRV